MLDPELADLLRQTATVTRWTSDDAYGAPQYSATSTDYPCRIVRTSRMVKDQRGRDVLATSTVYVGPNADGLPGLTVRDRVALSDGSSSQILAVAAHVDEAGDGHHEVLYCG